MSRKRILVSAYACNPFHGSEPGVGWSWVRAIALDHQVTVITADFNRESIEKADPPANNVTFKYVPSRAWHYKPTRNWKIIENSALKPLMNCAYAMWQLDAWKMANEIVREQPFDIVHQLTYVGYRFPGHLWKLGLPFVWGPVGGLENTPWSLLPAMGVYGAIYYGVRNLVNSGQRRWLRSPRWAAQAAGPGTIAATGAIARELRRLYSVESTVISEVTAPFDIKPTSAPVRVKGDSLRIVWSGLHLPGKALNLVLQALALLSPELDWRLDVLGDGPLRRRWQILAESLGLRARCHWHGKLPRGEAMLVMGKAHVLVISSLKDLTSTVLLEGLALGLPVICPDHCGFSDVVAESCGIKIPPRSIKGLVAGFATAIESLATDEPRRYRMAEEALRRARDYSWEHKRKELNRIYERVSLSFSDRSGG